jgi:hypothetical protein
MNSSFFYNQASARVSPALNCGLRTTLAQARFLSRLGRLGSLALLAGKPSRVFSCGLTTTCKVTWREEPSTLSRRVASTD